MRVKSTYPHHLAPPSHPHSSGRKHTACRGFYGWVSDSMEQGAKKQRFTGSIAMVYCWCSYAALLVQLCCTFGARMFYSSGTARTFDIPMLDLWYSYAVPLVPECYTLLVPFFYLIYSQCFRFDLSQFTSL